MPFLWIYFWPTRKDQGWWIGAFIHDLAYFTTRVPDTSDKSATPLRRHCLWVRNERHQYDMSASRTTRLRHELKKLILIMTWVKAFFHTLILTIWQMKDYMERKDFIRRTTLARFPAKMPLESVAQKLKFVIAKVISKSYRL